MVPYNQYAHAVIDDAEQKMKWKPFEIDAAEISLRGDLSMKFQKHQRRRP